MTNAFILAAALGLAAGRRRISDDAEIIMIPAGQVVEARHAARRDAWLKAEAARREADRAREQDRRRERAKTNFLPHAGERERRRRHRQIERGQLKAQNGLAP